MNYIAVVLAQSKFAQIQFALTVSFVVSGLKKQTRNKLVLCNFVFLL